MHPLDHLVVEPLCAAVKCIDEAPCAVELGLPWGECLVTRRDLIRMDQAFAVEAEAAAVLRLTQEAFRVVEAVEHAVEHGNAGSACGKHDHLQRGRNRLAI